jgi:hypothetical protein
MQLTRKLQQKFAFIENDLADAIAVLPSKSEHAAAEKEELLKVPLMFAKVNLYQKKWQKVIDNCDLVVGYSIVPNYASMFIWERMMLNQF